MSSKIEFVEYVVEQMELAGEITYKKMFGEFGIYCNGKIIGLVCDNQFFLKETEQAEKLLIEKIEMPPYTGSKPYFLIEQLEDREYLSKLVQLTYEILPEPKPKKKKDKKQ